MEARFQCGFGDYSNFLKAFKREFGKTPSKYNPPTQGNSSYIVVFS